MGYHLEVLGRKSPVAIAAPSDKTVWGMNAENKVIKSLNEDGLDELSHR